MVPLYIENDGFPLEFTLKGPQTELRTLNPNREQTFPKVQANMNYEQMGGFLTFPDLVAQILQDSVAIHCGAKSL